MKKIILTMFCGFLIAGCASTTYRNEYGGNKMRNNAEYEKMDANLRWQSNLEGCPIINYYENFPKYDEIVDVSITEQITTKKFIVLQLSKETVCSYSGTGVIYKKPAKEPVKQPETQPCETKIIQVPIQPPVENIDTIPSSNSIEVPADSTPSEEYAEQRLEEITNKYKIPTTEDSSGTFVTPPAPAKQITPEEREKMKASSRKYRDAMMKKKNEVKPEEPREDLSTHGNDSNPKRN